MNKILSLLLVLFLLPSAAHAALCATTTSDGQPAFLYKPDAKTGKITPTAYIFGVTKTLAPCSVSTVTIRKEIVETYVIPNPQNACEKSATLACEPSFGGSPICTTNNFQNFCGFCLVTTKAADDTGDVTIRYINGQVYDGTKVTGVGSTACPAPALLN